VRDPKCAGWRKMGCVPLFQWKGTPNWSWLDRPVVPYRRPETKLSSVTWVLHRLMHRWMTLQAPRATHCARHALGLGFHSFESGASWRTTRKLRCGPNLIGGAAGNSMPGFKVSNTDSQSCSIDSLSSPDQEKTVPTRRSRYFKKECCYWPAVH